MIREEALKTLEDLQDQYTIVGEVVTDKKLNAIFKNYSKAMSIAIAALRGPTREQVDRVLGSMWEFDANNFEYNWRCVTCGAYTDIKTDFCPRCGAPMTDKAMEITLRRLEEMKDGTEAN